MRKRLVIAAFFLVLLFCIVWFFREAQQRGASLAFEPSIDSETVDIVTDFLRQRPDLVERRKRTVFESFKSYLTMEEDGAVIEVWKDEDGKLFISLFGSSGDPASIEREYEIELTNGRARIVRTITTY